MKKSKSISRRNFIGKAAAIAGITVSVSENLFGQKAGVAMTSLPEEDVRNRFNALQKSEWKDVFQDSCRGDWREKWFLDGDRAKVENNAEGMTVHAGPTVASEADHAVLWTKDIFEADNLKIEYYFTRIDNSFADVGTVNIIYILAQGGGGKKPLDILEWADERREPNMGKYYNYMDAYHISYSVSQPPSSPPETDKYIRGRRYSASGLNNTELTPEYMNVPLFEQGVTYKMTFIKTGRELFLNVAGNGKDMVFYFDATKFAPITKGRIGLRQMFTRVSRYSDFKIFINK